jgi:uncharacterized protein
VKLLVDEPGSEEAGRVWARSTSRISSLVLYPEACAALAAAARGGRLGAASSHWRPVLDRLWNDVERSALTIDIARHAGDLAVRHALRGYDAVHLASFLGIADDESVLLTFDEDLRAAARSLGLAVAPAAPL